MLLPGLDDAGGLRAVAETPARRHRHVPMRLADGSELTVTATIGAAIQVSGTAARGPELVDRADRALYAGKRRGRDRAVLDVDLRAGDATGEDSDLLHTAQALALAVSIREGVPALHCQQVADLAARTAEGSACRRPSCCARASAAGCTMSARSRSRTASWPSARRWTPRSGR